MLDNLMNPDSNISMAEADEAFARYPYFALPQIKALDSVSDPESREILRRRIAMTAGDEEAVQRLVGIIPEEFNSFYPDMLPPSLSTDDTIDSFLSRYGKNDMPEQPIPIAAPAIDYASTFLEENEEENIYAPVDDTSSAIDSFLNNTNSGSGKKRKPESEISRVVAKPVSSAVPAKGSSSPALTESLARVMIKNHNYRKALEIIMELNLKNPEKNIYFADQIRFLKKLIINESKS